MPKKNCSNYVSKSHLKHIIECIYDIMYGMEVFEMSKVKQPIKSVAPKLNTDDHISLTKMSRDSKMLREKLKKYSAIRLLNRSDVEAIILSTDMYNQMNSYIEELEKELENANIRGIVEARDTKEREWLSGEELKIKMSKSFDDDLEEVRKRLNNDGQ